MTVLPANFSPRQQIKLWQGQVWQLTVSRSIVGRHLLPDANGLDDPEGDVPSFAKKLDVVITVVLGNRRRKSVRLGRSAAESK